MKSLIFFFATLIPLTSFSFDKQEVLQKLNDSQKTVHQKYCKQGVNFACENLKCPITKPECLEKRKKGEGLSKAEKAQAQEMKAQMAKACKAKTDKMENMQCMAEFSQTYIQKKCKEGDTKSCYLKELSESAMNFSQNIANDLQKQKSK